MGENLIVIGRISRPHGVKGEIRIEYFNPEDPHFFSRYQMIFIQGDQGSPQPYRPIKIRPHKHYILVTLEGIRNKEEAERLRGNLVLVDPAGLPPLEEDEYYWHEILGMRVVTEQGGDVGKITDILHTGSNDVYVVNKGKKEFLIPAIKDVIIAVERDTRTMVIRPLKGLLEEDDL
ncbi:MAG: 16S rRNA processing protein RimM [Deltaproteobacteria bacterium RBG_13_52_11]|nr:MAG: 16S rRNA processing protein RimM [Deltaproteobacteria bacterium RBG_13_52_11]